MREGAGGDEVDAGFGDGAYGVEADVAAGLGERAAGDLMHGGAQLVRGEVVEQDGVDAGGEDGLDLVGTVDMDFVGGGVRERGSGLPASGGECGLPPPQRTA